MGAMQQRLGGITRTARSSLAALLALFFVVGTLLATSPVSAADYYVSTTGSDSTGNGSSGSPWATIAKGLDGRSAGDVVHVAAGSYTGGNLIIGSGVSISGAGSSSVTYNYTGSGYNYALNVTPHATVTATIEGLTIDANGGTAGVLNTISSSATDAALVLSDLVIREFDSASGSGRLVNINGTKSLISLVNVDLTSNTAGELFRVRNGNAGPLLLTISGGSWTSNTGTVFGWSATTHYSGIKDLDIDGLTYSGNGADFVLWGTTEGTVSIANSTFDDNAGTVALDLATLATAADVSVLDNTFGNSTTGLKLAGDPTDPVTLYDNTFSTLTTGILGDGNTEVWDWVTFNPSKSNTFTSVTTNYDDIVLTDTGEGGGTTPQADLTINNESDSNSYIDDTYQTTPSGTQVQTAHQDRTTMWTWNIRVQNDGTGTQPYVLKATGSGGSGWTVTYKYDSTDISSSILGSGWTSSNIAEGAYITINVEVTADATVSFGATKDIVVQAGYVDGTYVVQDSVKGTYQVNTPQADLTINNENDSNYYIDDTYQTTPSGTQVQTTHQDRTTMWTWNIRVQNDGDIAQPYVLKATGSGGSGWTVTYKYNSTDISSSILGSGWTSSDIAVDAYITINVEVTADATVAYEATKDVVVQAGYVEGTYVVQDSVKGTYEVNTPASGEPEPPTGANYYYVSTTGNDTTGDGSLDYPWATIAKGLTGRSAGDTVYVIGGSYTGGNLTIPTGVSLQGAGSQYVTYNYTGSGYNYALNMTPHATVTATIEGLTIDANGGTAGVLNVVTSSATDAAIVLDDVIIQDFNSASGSGRLININGTKSLISMVNVDLTNNTAGDIFRIRNGSAAPLLLTISGGSWTSNTGTVFNYSSTTHYSGIKNLDIDGLTYSGNGADFVLWGTTEGTVSIANSTFDDNAGTVALDLATLATAADVSVLDNTFGNSTTGLKLAGDPTDPVTAYDNTFSTLTTGILGDGNTEVWDWVTFNPSKSNTFTSVTTNYDDIVLTDTGEGGGGTTPQADLTINNENDSNSYIDDTYQTTPSGTQVQTAHQDRTTMWTWNIRVQNDGNVAQPYVLKATGSGGSGWTVTYKYDSTDISSSILGGSGWTSSNIAVDAYITINVEVTADATVSFGATKDIVVQAGYVDGTYVVQDSVKGTYQVNTPQADLTINNENDSNYYIDDTYQTTPSGTQVQTTHQDRTTMWTWNIRVQNDGDIAQPYVLKATGSGGSGWTVTYKYNSTDIGSSIMSGSGWTSPDIAVDAYITINVEVTADTTLSYGATKDIVVQAGYVEGTYVVQDSVKGTYEVNTPAGEPTPPTGANYYYVSTTGNDTTGDGSLNSPWATIAKGLTGRSAGDTVYVIGGSYAGGNLSLASGVSLQGAGSQFVTYNYTGEPYNYTLTVTPHATITTTIQGMTIDANGSTAGVLNVYGSSATDAALVLSGMTIKDFNSASGSGRLININGTKSLISMVNVNLTGNTAGELFRVRNGDAGPLLLTISGGSWTGNTGTVFGWSATTHYSGIKNLSISGLTYSGNGADFVLWGTTEGTVSIQNSTFNNNNAGVVALDLATLATAAEVSVLDNTFSSSTTGLKLAGNPTEPVTIYDNTFGTLTTGILGSGSTDVWDWTTLDPAQTNTFTSVTTNYSGIELKDAEGGTPQPTPTDYYVNASTGNDSTGEGTLSLPWATIAKGLDGRLAGHTVYVAAGSYSGGTLTVPAGVKLTGAGSGSVTYNWTGGSGYALVHDAHASIATTISGLTIDGTSGTGSALDLGSSSTSNQLVTLSDVKVQDFGTSGQRIFSLDGYKSRLVLTNVNVQNNSTGAIFYLRNNGGSPLLLTVSGGSWTGNTATAFDYSSTSHFSGVKDLSISGLTYSSNSGDFVLWGTTEGSVTVQNSTFSDNAGSVALNLATLAAAADVNVLNNTLSSSTTGLQIAGDPIEPVTVIDNTFSSLTTGILGDGDTKVWDWTTFDPAESNTFTSVTTQTSNVSLEDATPSGGGGDPEVTGWFAAPDGKTPAQGGTGSFANPWDLDTAFNSSSIQPGDTVWFRGGTYYKPRNIENYADILVRLNGTSGNPITFRAYPGEHVKIDGRLQLNDPLYGKFLTFRDLELFISEWVNWYPRTGTFPGPQGGINVTYGQDVKVINCFIHSTHGPINAWAPLFGFEVYGTVMYDNGYMTTRWNGPAIYSQNLIQNPTRMILDNIFLENYSHPVQLYGSSSSRVNNFYIEGNFMKGHPDSDRKHSVLGSLGDSTNPATNLHMVNNVNYESGIQLGYGNGYTDNVSAVNNHIFRGDIWQSGTVTNKTVSGNWIWNTGDSIPSAPMVFVRQNQYESNRLHVAIYKWGSATHVNVDLSSYLTSGDYYEFRDPENFWGSAVVGGVYSSGSISVPVPGEFRTFIVLINP